MGMALTGAIAAIGFFSAFSGSLAGAFAARASQMGGYRLNGAFSGFTAGLLLAFVCFEILEEGFACAPLYIGVFGLIAGALASAFLEGAAAARVGSGKSPAVVAALGVMLHHLPEGVALGGLCAVSLSSGLKLAAAIAIHCAPEAAAVFGLRGNEAGAAKPKKYGVFVVCALLSLPVAAGSLAGALLMGTSSAFMSFSLTFSGGIMLYITCGETLPEARRVWSGRTTTLCALLGFILGVVITV